MLKLHNMKKEKLKLIPASVVLFFIFTSTAIAETSWSLQVDWPSAPGPEDRTLTAESGIADLVAYFYEWGIMIGVLIFFGILVYSGFRYLTSTGDPAKLKDAKKRIISGFSGVILLLGSYLILDVINPELTTIRSVVPRIEEIGSHEFSPGMEDETNLCEFAFVTVQEDETEGGEQTFFMIPGMSTAEFDEVFPVESVACVPERREDQIREVRESDTESAWLLIERESGEILDREEFDDDADASRLYRRRYYERTNTYEIQNDFLVDFLAGAQRNNNYNIFNEGECEDLIENRNFDRPRCIELDRDSRKIEEWGKIGYPSLARAYMYIEDKMNTAEGVPTSCPSGDDFEDYFGEDYFGVEDLLGYEKSTSGGGCSIAFYEGEETEGFWIFSSEVANCRKQVSRPSATMDHFDGIVDRETNCMELIRHEPPLDIEEEEFRHLIEIDIRRNPPIGRVRVENNRGGSTRRLSDGDIGMFPESDYTLEWSHSTAWSSYDITWVSPNCGTDANITTAISSECQTELNDDLKVEIELEPNY